MDVESPDGRTKNKIASLQTGNILVSTLWSKISLTLALTTEWYEQIKQYLIREGMRQ